MATSGSFSTGSVGSFYCTFDWYRTGYNSSANEHYIHYTVTAHNNPGYYRTVYLKNLWINGSQKFYSESGVSFYDGDVITSGDMTIPSSNEAGDGWFNASFEAGVGISSGSNCYGEGSWNLDKIPRYTTVWNSERGKTLNSISINWSTSDARDWTQYSLDDGNWQDAYDTIAWDEKSGYYTINNLSPNTTYKVRTRCRRKDSGLWSEAESIRITTYDIAKITKAPNIEHGDSLKIEYSNPSKATTQIALYKTDNVTKLTGGYRYCSGNSYTFNFTDEELDNIYKVYGRNSNQITVRAYIRTAENPEYWNYKDFTITLKGNQKTIKLYPVLNLKRGKIFINKGRTPKRAVIWTYESTGWKRGI